MLHKEYLTLLHKGHPGPEATKRRARNVVFWMTMTKNIDNFVQSCSTCNALKTHQPKEPLQLHAVPELPWSTVATDLFEWSSHHYLVLVDSYSVWFEMDQRTNIMSQCVINKLKQHFSVHGIPHKLLSDCGTQFTSQIFVTLPKTGISLMSLAVQNTI